MQIFLCSKKKTEEFEVIGPKRVRRCASGNFFKSLPIFNSIESQALNRQSKTMIKSIRMKIKFAMSASEFKRKREKKNKTHIHFLYGAQSQGEVCGICARESSVLETKQMRCKSQMSLCL